MVNWKKMINYNFLLLCNPCIQVVWLQINFIFHLVQIAFLTFIMWFKILRSISHIHCSTSFEIIDWWWKPISFKSFWEFKVNSHLFNCHFKVTHFPPASASIFKVRHHRGHCRMRNKSSMFLSAIYKNLIFLCSF